MPSTKQSKTVNNPPKPSTTTPQSPAKDSIASIRSLIENKFVSPEERIDAVENKITEQYEEVIIGSIRNIDKTAKSALDLAMSNSALNAENTEKISSHGFEYQTLLERLESLETENKKSRSSKRIRKIEV